jgi:hypothetical protein
MIDFLMLNHLSYATLTGFNEELLKMLGNPPESEITISKWDGDCARLPDAGPVFVHASKQLVCSRAELARACKRLGHVPFYDDALVGLNGELYPNALKLAVEVFLATYARRQQTQTRARARKKGKD